MTEFPKDINFKYPWRKYQQRVLDDLKNHLTDNHLHVIAPPGSGKTVLGLEVAIRLNKPTLILAPTIAIRNQWIQRFCELFLQSPLTPDWISRDIRNPRFLTVATYQGLHAACNNLKIEEEDLETEDTTIENSKSRNLNLDTIVKELKSQGVKTIVIDEAHHLKNEWWHTLIKVKEKLNPTIVGLTATPPYDVSLAEWQRYIELNGPVDTEITVPELIIEGDLCPHQDYIYYSLPSEKENKTIIDFRQNIETLFLEIKEDKTIKKALVDHPLWANPTEHLEWIYNNIPYYSSALIFLNANGIEIPKIHLEIIGDKKIKIPVLNYEWMEVLLDFYLYHDLENFSEFVDHKKSLEARLRRKGAIERKQINFSNNKQLSKFITSSISKLNSIKDIVDFEYKQLGNTLRLVILSDYIRKEFLINSRENNIELNKLGVIPIFEKLRRENLEDKKLAVLTGSIIIIPKNAYSSFIERTKKLGFDKIQSNEVPYDNRYIQIHQSEKLKNDIVHIITQIFQNGEIEILIGTKSLLGEGWDAPAINSLILASFVGSFVLSNQMRGRAIRIQNNNHNKTGNIWHLVCIDPTSQTGGEDIELLERRFKAFVGISYNDNPSIENGIGRLNPPTTINNSIELIKKNAETFSFAKDRENLKKRWDKALENGTNLIEEIKVPFQEEKTYSAIKSLYFNKTIKNLIATLASGLLGFGLEILQALGKAAKNIKTLRDLYYYLAFFGVLGIFIFGRKTYNALRLYITYRDISKDLHQIGKALLKSLLKADLIKTNESELDVVTSIDSWGSVYCHLDGGTTFDKSTFINALQEIIAPVNNPRYIILRKNKFILFAKQNDYHAVPENLGRNKKIAEYFENQWGQLVGNCELIYTRTIDGRKLLLKSRIKSLSAQFKETVEHVNKWR